MQVNTLPPPTTSARSVLGKRSMLSRICCDNATLLRISRSFFCSAGCQIRGGDSRMESRWMEAGELSGDDVWNGLRAWDSVFEPCLPPQHTAELQSCVFPPFDAEKRPKGSKSKAAWPLVQSLQDFQKLFEVKLFQASHIRRNTPASHSHLLPLIGSLLLFMKKQKCNLFFLCRRRELPAVYI